MRRLIFFSLFAIVNFTLLPGLVTNWMEVNGYLEPDAMSAQQASPSDQADTHSSGLGRTVLKADAAGHFFASARLNGKTARVVIDTGATLVALPYSEARRIGLKPLKSDFKHAMNTANGVVHYARARLRDVRIGQVSVRNVEVVIAPEGALQVTLMGMSFIKKLRSFQLENGRLILEG